MFAQAYVKQREEQKKGNYVFIMDAALSGNICLMFISRHSILLNADKKVGDDYTFLRFALEKSIYTMHQEGVDALWMNGALYAMQKK